MVECAECGAPVPSDPDGLCRPCRERTSNAPDTQAAPPIVRDIKAHGTAFASWLGCPEHGRAC
jgi:hypothetical protein